ncbi:MAG: hypothetical protein IT436_11830 [Phycisphaerales bacterium]|nr:hypothetical protein [Phycisphaerales bacterium]
MITAFHLARAEVATLFSAAGLDPTKTRESARELGINRGLGWRLSRMVRESDPSVAASDVPGSQSMARFFEACRQRGAPENAIAAAIAALDRFEAALSSCSGDRKTLAMLMANRRDTGGRTETDKVRRTLFEGACGVWGVQAQTRFVTVFVFPSPDDPGMLDAGHVTGFVGFRRLSAKPWPLSYEAVHKSSGAVAPFIKEPLDPVGAGEGKLQLMKRYCSPPDMDVQVVMGGDYKRFELAAGPVGNEGLTTCVFGTRLRSLYPRYSATPDTAGFMVLMSTPVERVLFDMFVHRDLGVTTPPRAQLLDRLGFPHSNDESQFDRQSLQVPEAPELLPDGLAGTLCPYIPWYSKLVEDVTARVGHSIDEFVGSRFEMRYPPISTTLSRRFDLKPGPA